MTKLRDIVQINSGYTSYVDLYDEYYDIAKNRGRMERYKPITAHRHVFDQVSNALNPRDRRFYFLSGSYGTGKSHLLLMLANFFANTSDVPEIETFFNNYKAAQEDVLLRANEVLQEKKAAALKDARKSGRYLVALCRYSLNLDFEGALLRALEDSLLRENNGLLIDSHYQEAVRRLTDWQARQNTTHYHSQFLNALSSLYPDWTFNDLLSGLKTYDSEALTTFKGCFKQATDTDFSFNKDNLRDIITDFLKNPDFKKQYKGIVFLYDEFGAALDANLVNYTTLLDFAQYCASSTLEQNGAVIFVGAGHKSFTSSGHVGDLNRETLAARVTEIGLETQGMEDIIAAIVHLKKDSPEWKKEVEPNAGKFAWFSNECNRLKLFNWLPAPKIKNNIIQNIFPMHPLATYSLLRLAAEAGSDNRSVFRFFAPEFETGVNGWTDVQPYSYPWFLENSEIRTNNKLNMYTSDLLVDYFRDSIKASNSRLVERVSNIVINYETSLRELNTYLERKSEDQLFAEADELMFRILKVILVNEIASTQDVPIANTTQNIEFALEFVAPEEKTQVEERLNLLSKAGVIFNNNGIYELISGDRKEIRRIVDRFKADPANRPSNLLQGFLNALPLRNDEIYLEAKDYNSAFSEDKRMKVVLARPADLTETFFNNLELNRKQIRPGVNSYEGTSVYVFCEDEADINAAKKTISQNHQPRVSVAIPRSPLSVFDALFTVKALDSDLFRQKAQDFTPYERVEEMSIRDEATKILKQTKESYFSNAKVQWFGENGAEIPVNIYKYYDAANILMDKLYGTKRNTFAHNELNKVHTNLSAQVKRIFEEAGDLLTDLSQPIIVNWTWPDNRGGIRYLRNAFVNHQALKIDSIRDDDRLLEAETNRTKFQHFLPAYARLLDDLEDFEGKGPKPISQVISPLFEEYGQGDVAVTLYLLLARRLFGDSLRFKRDPNNLMDIQFTTTNDMLSLVQGQYPSAVILFEEVTQEDKEYFRVITQIFSNQPTPAGKVYSINDAYHAIVSWWDQLPSLSHTLDFYSNDQRPLAEAVCQAKTKEPFRFIKIDLQSLFGAAQGGTLTSQRTAAISIHLKNFKLIAEAIQQGIERKILERIAEIFGASSAVDIDVQEALRNWYTSLSLTQKDYLTNFHNTASRPLVKFNSYSNIRELLFKTLPEAYFLEPVVNWKSNKIENLSNLIQTGKRHIEINAPQIGVVKLAYDDHSTLKGDQVTFTGKLNITAEIDGGDGKIFYTMDGSDPTSSGERKILPSGKVLSVTGNRKVKLVVADEKGNYSVIKTINAINILEKHKIVRPQQSTALDEPITFIFPRDIDSARITIQSMLTEIAMAGLFTGEELNEEVLLILDEINKKAHS